MTDSPFPTSAEQPEAAPAEMQMPPQVRTRKTITVAAGGAVGAIALVVGAFLAHGGSSAANTNTPASNQPSNSSGASAAPAARPGAAGTIASKSGSILTITNASGQKVTVVTNGGTAVTRTMPGSLADIKVGDHVIARGTTTGTAVAATGVTDLGTSPPPQNAARGNNGGTPPGAPNANTANRGSQGTVTALGPSGFTMTDANGTSLSVSTNGSTTFNVTSNSTAASLVVGEQIQANGATANDGTVTATAIRVGGGGGNPNNPSAGG